MAVSGASMKLPSDNPSKSGLRSPADSSIAASARATNQCVLRME